MPQLEPDTPDHSFPTSPGAHALSLPIPKPDSPLVRGLG